MVMVANPGPPFTRLRILHDRELLNVLKLLVTMKATPGVLTKALGISLHLHQAIAMGNVLKELTHLSIAFNSHKEEVVKAVEEAIENKALEAGQVTGTRLRSMLDVFHRENLQRLEELKGEILEQARENRNRNEKRNLSRRGEGQKGDKYQYVYDGRFMLVPKDFEFPSPRLREGLQFWLKGQSVLQDGASRVQPFHKLVPHCLPKKARKPFNVKWKPVFSFLEEGVKHRGNDSRRGERKV